MKTALTLFLFLISLTGFNTIVHSQNLLVDNFNYPVRDSLEGYGGWEISGLDSPYNIKVISPGLVYPGYLGSGIGNALSFSNQTNGDICFQSFPIQTAGSVYMSFMIRVDSLSASATSGYNICFNHQESTNLNTKPFIKKITSSTFNFGIEKNSGTVSYSPTVYSTNVTYLVVVKYTFVPGTDNDSAKIFVFNSGVPATEPAVPAAFDVSDIDMLNEVQVYVSNSYAQNGLQGSSVKLDGIRIGTTWSNTLLTPINMNLKLTALIQGLYNDVTNKMVKDTARVQLRFNTPPYSLVDSSKSVLDSNGKGTFLFGNTNNSMPYYIVVRQRNSIETWSSAGFSFFQDSLNYDFTPGTYQAYGNNMIIKGVRACLFSGDVNQDGVIDLLDIVAIYNGATNFVTGYVSTDVNGDNFTNLTDLIITYNNSLNFIHIMKP